MLKHILPLIPEKPRTYVEPFVGGGAVFFAKKPNRVEVINDNYDACVNFYRICQNKESFRRLSQMLCGTLHSETDYRKAKEIMKNPTDYSPIVRAWAFWVQCHLTFGHKICGEFACLRASRKKWH